MAVGEGKAMNECEYAVEVSYSGGTFWTHYYTTDSLYNARAVCDSLSKLGGNIKPRIVKKEIIE
jgi:hypothetical protein